MKSFYSHYAAWGSYASFILGKFGSGGGFVLQDVQSPDKNIYIGFKRGEEKLRLLPFIRDFSADSGRERYDESFSDDKASSLRERASPFRDGEISRESRWATETWTAGAMSLRFHTPFAEVPSPETMNVETARFMLAPLIVAVISFDNTDSSKPLTGIFALQGMRRPLSDTLGAKDGLGAANGVSCGFAAKAQEGVKEVFGWDVLGNAIFQPKPWNMLGAEGGLSFAVPPGEKRTFKIVLATYRDGFISSGIQSQLSYTCYFNNLEEVLDYGLEKAEDYIRLAEKRDEELSRKGLNEHRAFLLAHSTRSYLANTELLVTRKAEHLFIVNEGEYRMMNTMDLTVDQVYWELQFTPWTVRNELDSFVARSSYRDSYGLGFNHDQGVADMFTPKGDSSYETPGLSGCFSYMTVEETMNWALTAALYVEKTKDEVWLKENAGVLKDILDSLIARDANGDGIMDRDSDRCEGGAEITTYDSLDISLGQARNNLYLAVKAWAAYLCLGKLFSRLGDEAHAKIGESRAVLAADTIVSRYDAKEGFIPAVFEKNNISRIIPAIEGLIYPFMIGDKDAVSEKGRFGALVGALSSHFATVLKKGICIDAVSGGWKLSSSSKNTWLSKIFLNEFIAERILGYKSKSWEIWDGVHASWQKDGSSRFAATDQVDSTNGRDLGSRLYPRLVTSVLWLRY